MKSLLAKACVKNGRLIINGHDVTRGLLAYTAGGSVDQPPTLRLELALSSWEDDGSLLRHVDRSSTTVLK